MVVFLHFEASLTFFQYSIMVNSFQHSIYNRWKHSTFAFVPCTTSNATVTQTCAWTISNTLSIAVPTPLKHQLGQTYIVSIPFLEGLPPSLALLFRRSPSRSWWLHPILFQLLYRTFWHALYTSSCWIRTHCKSCTWSSPSCRPYGRSGRADLDFSCSWGYIHTACRWRASLFLLPRCFVADSKRS